VTFLAWLNIYQSLKQAIQDVIAPEMQQLDKQFDAIDKRFESVDKRL